jgi:hypothetical protein
VAGYGRQPQLEDEGLWSVAQSVAMIAEEPWPVTEQTTPEQP